MARALFAPAAAGLGALALASLASLGYVSRARGELEIGDRVVMRAGY